jgi:hypothetical protein
MTQGNQLRHHSALAATESSPEDSDQRRQIQRTVYVEFINDWTRASGQLLDAGRSELTRDHFPTRAVGRNYDAATYDLARHAGLAA